MSKSVSVERNAQPLLKGNLSRREFVTKLGLLGLSPPAVGGLLAASRRAPAAATAAPAATSVGAATAMQDTADGRAIALAKEAAQGQDITLTIMHPSGAKANFDPLASQWTEATGIKIKLVESELTKVFQRAMQEAITKTSTYDIYIVDALSVPDLADANLIADLTENIQEYNAELSTGDSPILPPMDVRGKYKGRDFAIPSDGDVYQLFLRTDLLQDPKNQADFKAKYGMDLNPPETLDEYNKQLEFFTRADGSLYGGPTSAPSATPTGRISHSWQRTVASRSTTTCNRNSPHLRALPRPRRWSTLQIPAPRHVDFRLGRAILRLRERQGVLRVLLALVPEVQQQPEQLESCRPVRAVRRAQGDRQRQVLPGNDVLGRLDLDSLELLEGTAARLRLRAMDDEPRGLCGGRQQGRGVRPLPQKSLQLPGRRQGIRPGLHRSWASQRRGVDSRHHPAGRQRVRRCPDAQPKCRLLHRQAGGGCAEGGGGCLEADDQRLGRDNQKAAWQGLKQAYPADVRAAMIG